MRIIVNDIAASSGGSLSILKDFYNSVRKYDIRNEYIFLLSDNYLEETENIKIKLLPEVKKSKWNKLLFDFILGKYYIKKLRPDVVFSLQNIIVFGVKKPQIVYIHQSLPFQKEKNFSVIKKEERGLAICQKIIGRIINLSAKKADKIIVQTEWMRSAVEQKAEVSKDKIVKILPSIYIEKVTDVNKRWNNKLFFYPTTNVVYKNIGCIERACILLNDEAITDFNVNLTILGERKKNINYIGMLSREEVIEKYFSCTLIFPSYIETFGLPIAEAKEVGTVIVASDCEFSREILKGYENAYFFDYKKPDQLAEIMKLIINGKIKKREKVINVDHNKKNNWIKIIKIIENFDKR